MPYLFALESAMDELAVALDLDPLELRRRNDTEREPIKGLPYTSRSLMACFDAAAAAFGCFRLQRIAGWALHRLESAALSRRTPKRSLFALPRNGSARQGRNRPRRWRCALI